VRMANVTKTNVKTEMTGMSLEKLEYTHDWRTNSVKNDVAREWPVFQEKILPKRPEPGTVKNRQRGFKRPCKKARNGGGRK